MTARTDEEIARDVCNADGGHEPNDHSIALVAAGRAEGRAEAHDAAEAAVNRIGSRAFREAERRGWIEALRECEMIAAGVATASSSIGPDPRFSADAYYIRDRIRARLREIEGEK